MQPFHRVHTTYLHHHQQQPPPPQRLVADDCCCSSGLPVLDPETVIHSYNQPRNLQQQQQQSDCSVPITYQLFQQQTIKFQCDEAQQQQRQQQQYPSFPALNFKLGLKEDTCNVAACALNMSDYWRPEEHHHIATKQPFWKPLDEVDRQNDESENGETTKRTCHYKTWHAQDVDSKYRLFNEVEAIYNLAKIHENQAGFKSAMPVYNQNVTAISNPDGVDHATENSSRAEASLSIKNRKRKRKKRMKEDLTSMAKFFQSLAKEVSDHQDLLLKRFIEVIERMDKERTERDKAWRSQRAENSNTEAIIRAQEQALASSRESQIVSYIEKITGKSINLPARETVSIQQENSRDPIKESSQINTEVGPMGSEHCEHKEKEDPEDVKIKIREEKQDNIGDDGNDLRMEIDKSGLN